MVRTGRRWIVLDADFFTNPFADRLLGEFGPAGLCVWIALLCAAKRSRIQGEVNYSSDTEARYVLSINDIELVNHLGVPWALNDLWALTGKMKQTRIKRHGRQIKLKVTNWSQWQETLTREMAAERMRRSRAGSARTESEQFWHASRTENAPDLDLDHDKNRDASQRQNGQVNPARKLKAAMRGDDA